MADARHRIWHLAGPALAASALLAGLASPGCGNNNTTSTSTAGTAGTGGTGGTGGTTTGPGPGGSTTSTGGGMTTTTSTTGSGGGMPGPTAAIAAPSPFDSTPDSTAANIYFTGADSGLPGIYNVDGKGGTPTVLFSGDPLAAPFGITISSDDMKLFVADTGYDTKAGDPDTPVGAVLTMGTAPGTPTVLGGTEGFRPRGVDIFVGANGDVLYFTGIDPASASPGVFTIPPAGGVVSTFSKGESFVDPSGVAVGTDAGGKPIAYVTDAVGADVQIARLLLVDSMANVTTFVDNLGVGYPAGVALSSDGKTVYVSGIDLATGTDRILIVDVASKMVTSFGMANMMIGNNTDAGGLHRARKSEVYSWADLTAGGAGTVYRIEIK